MEFITIAGTQLCNVTAKNIAVASLTAEIGSLLAWLPIVETGESKNISNLFLSWGPIANMTFWLLLNLRLETMPQ